EDTINMLKQGHADRVGGVLHCFTENWEMAKAAIDLGFYISVSGIVTFKNAGELRTVIRKVPKDRLLVETDSPYLAPIPHRGQENQPAYVRDVAEFVAELRGERYEDLAEYTSHNFFTLFKDAARLVGR
ncbi:MAG: TatD family hydrolase, partial [Shewanella sp.]